VLSEQILSGTSAYERPFSTTNHQFWSVQRFVCMRSARLAVLVTKQLLARIHAFDMWCLRKILRIPYTRHVTNVEVRRVTGCSAASAASRLVCMCRRQLFGHLARRPDEEDHHRIMVAAMSNPPTEWKRPRGRPRETWLRTVSKDIQPFNFGIHSAWQRAADCQQWHELINTANPLCSSRSTPSRRKVEKKLKK